MRWLSWSGRLVVRTAGAAHRAPGPSGFNEQARDCQSHTSPRGGRFSCPRPHSSSVSGWELTADRGTDESPGAPGTMITDGSLSDRFLLSPNWKLQIRYQDVGGAGVPGARGRCFLLSSLGVGLLSLLSVSKLLLRLSLLWTSSFSKTLISSLSAPCPIQDHLLLRSFT